MEGWIYFSDSEGVIGAVVLVPHIVSCFSRSARMAASFWATSFSACVDSRIQVVPGPQRRKAHALISNIYIEKWVMSQVCTIKNGSI